MALEASSVKHRRCAKEEMEVREVVVVRSSLAAD